MLNVAIARLRYEQGRYDEAESMFNNLVSVMERHFGPEDEKTLDLRGELANVYADWSIHGTEPREFRRRQIRRTAAAQPARLVSFGRKDFHRTLKSKFGLADR